jgi:hypothetical protein
MQSKALKAVTVTLRTNQRLLKPLLTVGLAQQQQVVCTAAASATQVKMLRRLHNHIFACKLKEVFESQVVLVYQTMGHIDHLGLKQQVQAGLAKEPSVKDAHFKVCQMRNSVAVATGDDTLSKLFTNSNLLIGFKLPEQQQQLQQQQDSMQPLLEQQQHQQQQDAQYQGLISAALQKVQYDMSPQQVVGGLLDHPQPGPHVPQPALKAFVETGVQLPSEQPLVLIGAFYKSSATPLSRLRKWIKLDARQVSALGYGLLSLFESWSSFGRCQWGCHGSITLGLSAICVCRRLWLCRA